jgi:hypothetical protein
MAGTAKLEPDLKPFIFKGFSESLTKTHLLLEVNSPQKSQGGVSTQR